jgi:hypothetical protein
MPEGWPGPPRPDESGNIAVEGYNRFLARHPDLGRSPVRATIEFVRLKDPRALTTTVRAQASRLENPRDVRVTLTEDGLPDDSSERSATGWSSSEPAAGGSSNRPAGPSGASRVGGTSVSRPGRACDG